MSIIYNEMKQPIKHKGQICKGDIVYIEAGGAPYKVTECKDGSGVIKSFVGFKRDITFIEGKGWRNTGSRYWSASSLTLNGTTMNIDTVTFRF